MQEQLTDALIASARADDGSPFPTLAAHVAAIGAAMNVALATIAAEHPDADDAAALEAIATEFVFEFAPFEVPVRDAREAVMPAGAEVSSYNAGQGR